MTNNLRQQKPVISAVIIYYLMLLAYLVLSLVPQYRVWGFSHWGHFPTTVMLIFFGAGFIAPVIMLYVWRTQPSARDEADEPGSDTLKLVITLILLAAVFGAAFYLLRTRLHFLGDGYTLLSNLASDKPIVKDRNLGVIMAHKFVFSLLSGEINQKALLTYRVVSMSSGVLFVLTLLAAGRLLYGNIKAGLLFALGLLSGGYTLLFFGYVEHYAPFVFTVALFGLVGLFIAQKKLNRWWILPPLVLAIFWHVFGVTLIPAAIYILVAETKLSSALVGLKLWVKLVLIGVVLAAMAVAFYHFYSTVYFFRFALVPVVADRFTADGYTFFSLKHIVDMGNLLIMLVPGLPVLVYLAYPRFKRGKVFDRKTRFMIVLMLSTVGAAALFDPKLGMPRDWDLFAFCGIPVALFMFDAVISDSATVKRYAAAVALAIVIGLVALLSRAYHETQPEISIPKVKDYIALDAQRNRRALNILVDYYKNLGDTVSARNEFEQWESAFPEWATNKYGQLLLENRQYAEAVGYFRRTIAINPSLSAAYSNLGSAYLYLRQYDSAIAYLEIANGMNPHSPPQLSNLGAAYFHNGQHDKAEKCLDRAVDLDSSNVSARLTLVMLYRTTKRTDEYVSALVELSQNPSVPVALLEELIAHYIRSEEYDLAAETIHMAVSRGMDSVVVKLLKAKYPMLPL
ncbi:MAG: tetratricopeptide repeat protein [Candidatus Zixiibacteriota bacterium]|nr:MAG: tetratricopeptide repeat protein [candidate division Zixibacteria bacterium]